MKLNVLERLKVLELLPKEGDVTTIKLVRKLRESLSFSEEEHKTLNFRQLGTQLQWSKKEVPEKDVHFGEIGIKMIVDALKQLDKIKKLKEAHLSLYEKFVEKEREEKK